ncbi:hypothetical protein [Dactylosporangium sp. CA-233914]|uniref:hypothetical protein n=1 Tax=Dactylosporangium sp. CA-233914 TaxID=3239934 RepID=UPI003D8A91E4
MPDRTPNPAADTAASAQRLHVEGPVAREGDVRLEGTYVAGHDIVFVGGRSGRDDPAPFLTVDRDYLQEQSRKQKRVFVARAPDWADVVHGFDEQLRFIERDQTDELLATVRAELLEPCVRGTDSRLHAIVVQGAPGAGKSTLVRRVAALLVLAGECVVADFGISTRSVSPQDTAAYIGALDKLAGNGLPVLVLLDDPFFANSGWVDFLNALSRPQHHGIAVLSASPDFLFQRFAHWLFGRRVVGRTIDVSRPSNEERRSLALLYDREPAAALASDEDLLVIAMEAAAGESFGTIIQRIWTTLNGGVPLDPAADHRGLPWQVVAFAVACYFHRNYVMCPEPLLRELLLQTLVDTPPSYLTQELQDLVTREGWHIFSVRGDGEPSSGVLRLIGSTHARVAREAWNHLPLRNLDVERLVVDVSVRVPQTTAQVAELILAVLSSPRKRERALVNRFAVRWSRAVEQGAIETHAVCALVRHLRPSRTARLNFRPVLRKCLTAQDSQSWLAAWQLYHMASAATHPQERDFLVKVNLPWTLRHADFSKGPVEAVEIAERMGGEIRHIVVDRLISALRGELDWRADAHQVAWLIGSLPAPKAVDLLQHVCDWLEDGLVEAPTAGRTPDGQAVAALVELLGRAEIDTAARERISGAVTDWLMTTEHVDARIITRILAATEDGVRSGDPVAAANVSRVADLLLELPENNEVAWAALLRLLSRSPGLAQETRRIVPALFERLLDRPESNESVWAALLGLLGRSAGLAQETRRIVPQVIEWLQERPESNESVWTGALTLLGSSPVLAGEAAGIVPQVFQWLQDRPESNESAWSGLLTLLGSSPDLAGEARRIVPIVFERLLARPESNEGAWSTLLGLLGRLPDLAEEARRSVPQVFQWLQDRPESNESAWSGLLTLLGSSPDLAGEARRIVPIVFERLLARPENNEGVWASLLGLLGRSPDLADEARRIVPQLLEWLRQRPEGNESAWSGLLTLLGSHPDLAGEARRIVPIVFERLLARPESNETVWAALLRLLGRSPDLADEARRIVPVAFERLLARPESNEGVWAALLGLLGRSPALVGQRRRIALGAFTWLSGRDEGNVSAWSTLLSVVGSSPELADEARQIVRSVVERLLSRPESNEPIWATLLGLLGRSADLADEAPQILPKVLSWLLGRDENNEGIWAALLELPGRSPEVERQARAMLPVVYERLLSRPESNEGVWSTLLALLSRSPYLADEALRIVPAAFEWLEARLVANWGTRGGMLLALSAPIEFPAPERAHMVDMLHRWIDRYHEGDTAMGRGVWLLVLAARDDAELASVAQRELEYVEQHRPPELHIVFPLGYALRQLARADLTDRLLAWARAYLEVRTTEFGLYQLFVVALIDAMTAGAEHSPGSV